MTKIRRMLLMVLAAVLLFPSVQGTAQAASRTHVNVYIDDALLVMDVDAYAQNGRTTLPFRALFEALNAKVKWDPNTQTVTGDNVQVNGLTDAKTAGEGNLTTKEVHLLPMDGGRYLVHWNQATNAPECTWYAIVNGTGATVKGPAKLGVPAPGHIDPLKFGNKPIWYVLRDGKTAFVTIDLTKL